MSSNQKSIAYDEINVVIAAGDIQKNIQAFDWLECISTDNDTLECSIDDGASFARMRNGIKIRPIGGINGNVLLRNPSGSTLTATLATGTAEMDDNRLVLTGTGVLPVSMAAGKVHGIVAEGGTGVAVNPVRIAGVNPDGNLATPQLNESNQLAVTCRGGSASGSAPDGGPIMMGGYDQANNAVRQLRATPTGFPIHMRRFAVGDPLRALVSSAGIGVTNLIPAPGAGFQIAIHSIALASVNGALTHVQITDGVKQFRLINGGDGHCERTFASVPWLADGNTAVDVNAITAGQLYVDVVYTIEG